MQFLPTDVTSMSLKTEDGATTTPNDNPQTLLGLLHRAVRTWPTHGIMFKDQGWDQISDFITYADLLRQAEVKNAIG
jgi:hypothetical protein